MSNVTLEVYNPTGATEKTQRHAPRLDTLEGKTICELVNGSWQVQRTFPLIRQLLQKRFPSAKFIPYTEFPSGQDIDSDRTADILVEKGCQGVILGNAG
ncbi:MAG: hypothetical protein HYX87_00380 [Chloroflexi bacterium]|nr:hypothetical protein [Chloroflexota bacterium]